MWKKLLIYHVNWWKNLNTGWYTDTFSRGQAMGPTDKTLGGWKESLGKHKKMLDLYASAV